MSKKNTLANQLNAFSEGLKEVTPIKITPQVKISESETVENASQTTNLTNLKISKKKNKLKEGETVQMSIIIPKKLQKRLKTLSLKTEKKVNTLILEAIETNLLSLL
jgi:predicted DNA-binding antitoxin AbrB/MazE fold protein